jgi:hypothetical protein
MQHGPAMGMAVTRRPLNNENRVQAQASSRRVCSGLSITGTGYSKSNLLYISFNTEGNTLIRTLLHFVATLCRRSGNTDRHCTQLVNGTRMTTWDFRGHKNLIQYANNGKRRNQFGNEQAVVTVTIHTFIQEVPNPNLCRDSVLTRSIWC